MATIADVARMARVSVSTVSHVVNSTRHVNAETKELVMLAIRKLDYVPNAVARSLARSSTNTVGIAIAAGHNPYFNDIVSSIERSFFAAGQLVFVCDTRNDPGTEMQAVREFVQRRVDGVVLAPSADPENLAISYLKANNMPLVLVDRITTADVDGVCLQNILAMEMLVDHLVGHGHTRIGLVPGEPGLRSTMERIEGYAATLKRHRIKADPALVASCSSTSEEAYESARYLSRLNPPPTAIIGGNNLATIAAMRAASDAGLRVPDDLALVGFDDFEWANCFEPRLTVIAQPSGAIGLLAAEMLSQRIRFPDGETRQSRLEPTLVIRRSCGCRGH